MNTDLRAVAQSFTALEDWLAWLETLHPKKIDLSLDRIRSVLDRLSLSDPPFRTITIGGTNGKGSCVAMLESIYRCAGYRVGSFTSPHLWRFNERIRMDGREASDARLMELFSVIEEARDSITLSYFEYSAVAALLHFAKAEAQLVLMEVGLGGRLDAVNALDADVSLVVSVDLDHQAWLGEDREAIGREKAGIFRPEQPAIVADRNPPESVLGYAQRQGVHLRLIGRDFDWRETGNGWSYEGWARREQDLPAPPFGGRGQLANAAACLAVIEAMAAHLPVESAAIRRGLAAARLTGRVERYECDGVEWVFDVAHNPAAARMLANELTRLTAADCTWAVFASMGDKDISGVIAPFVDLVDQWIVTRADSERGAATETLTGLLEAQGVTRVRSVPHVGAACDLVLGLAQPGQRVLVFGSFYMVGPAMSALGLYSAPSQPGDQSARWIGA